MLKKMTVGVVGIGCALSSFTVDSSVEVVDSEPIQVERIRSDLSDAGYVDAQRDKCGRGRKVLLEPFRHDRSEYNEGYRHGVRLIEERPELCAVVRALLPEVYEV